MTDRNKAIADEIRAEEEAAVMAEYEPKAVGKTQVKGAKFAWMAVAVLIDLATAYAYILILSPFWWYAMMWIMASAGGLLFAEWLWERVGNNDEQTRIADASKKVSAGAVILMAVLSGLALILGWQRNEWMEVFALVSAVGLICFHGLQAYRYHEVDDDYIAMTIEARAEAANMKEIKKIHRAGRRVKAKNRVHDLGEEYQKQHGEAFAVAAGRTFSANADAPKSNGGGQNPRTE